MHLHYTSAPSSRITKPRKRNPLLRSRPRPRSTSSPFSTHPRRKALTTPSSPTKPSSPTPPSTDAPPSTNLLPFPTLPSLTTIPAALTHALSTKFTSLPPRNAGLSSVRIAHVLNFRAALPPLVTLPHLHALLGAPTRTERLLAECVREGTVRKLAVQTRAVAAPGGVLEGVVLVQGAEGLEGLVRRCAALEGVEGLIDKFLNLLRQNPSSPTLSRSQFTPAETHALLHSGFLVRAPAFLSSAHISNTSFPTSSSSTSTTELTSAISLARVGVNTNTKTNTTFPPSRQQQRQRRQQQQEDEVQKEKDPLSLSLPSLGPYLKHLHLSKSHLFSLLSQTRTKELPLPLLRERWDGTSSISNPNNPSTATSATSGGFNASPADELSARSGSSVMTKVPAKMTKWKYLHGASLEWVLAEAVGAGEVEVFESGVGLGVRDVR
ncbi:MAG: hypothetical protein M1824_000494 [Vezdaea acicularis]|nr:MAG: hypothetical protein M1824_000494 [Vezdaea acicularis]